MTELVCLSDYESKSRPLLDKRAADYYSTGADDEQTLADNTAHFKRLRLRPKMMVDVSNIKLHTTILGEQIDFPVCIAPSGMQGLAHHQGEVATVRAADGMGTCMCLSTGSNYSMEEVAEAAPNALKWFQLYVNKDLEVTKTFVRRAEKAGYKAIVVTVDRPEVGSRRNNLRNKFSLPSHLKFGNYEGLAELKGNVYKHVHSLFASNLTWKDIAWLTTITKLPIIAKGVLTGHDALQALDAGCSAIYVSNHGGRQLDGVSSTILALEEVVKAVNGRAEVYMDSGVRCGTDALKALALGARAVFIGRPIFWGLGIGGEDGVRAILSILKKELKLAMQLSGVTDVEKVPRDLVYYDFTQSRL